MTPQIAPEAIVLNRKSFNLVDAPWIPMVGRAPASLMEVFTDLSPGQIGGNAMQKVAIFKLLQAIAQAAHTPLGTDEWKAIGTSGLAATARHYLAHWHDRFDLYGQHPFLQMPTIASAATVRAAALLPQSASGNTTVLNQTQVMKHMEDADLALLLVSLSAFALGGKKADNSVVLTPGYTGKFNPQGKPSSGRAGPAVSFGGLLHSFLLGDSIAQTVWMNLLTKEDIAAVAPVFPQGLGKAPWEDMPQGEACPVASAHKKSLMGRLMPLCRFCLIAEDGQHMHYSEGLWHQGYKDGVSDPTVSTGMFGKKQDDPKALWCNPDKRPWRELVSLLGVLGQSSSTRLNCLQLDRCMPRVRQSVEDFSVWSGGVSVSSNAGEQYLTGSDDMVESVVRLNSRALGQVWFQRFSAEMIQLDALSKRVYGAVSGYFKEQKMQGEDQASVAAHLFWQLAERHAQALVEACDAEDENVVDPLPLLRQKFAQCAWQVFDLSCANETARQMGAWSKTRPHFGKYINEGVVK